MIYRSTQSNDYLWYLILREKHKNEKKLNTPTRIRSSFPFFSMVGTITSRHVSDDFKQKNFVSNPSKLKGPNFHTYTKKILYLQISYHSVEDAIRTSLLRGLLRPGQKLPLMALHVHCIGHPSTVLIATNAQFTKLVININQRCDILFLINQFNDCQIKLTTH